MILLSSCFGPRLIYNVGLSNVEAPSDAKKQYGKTKIISLDIDGKLTTNMNMTISTYRGLLVAHILHLY